MSIVNVPRSDVIVNVAKELKKMHEFKPPLWSKLVKTGCHTERPPVNPDWWFVRIASVMSKLNDLGPVGVSKLRTKYGGKK
ncbi:40S ribosomal protein S19, partial [Candidatus Woesearchaeota archaeon]|nr:40S ribosomal protein S19 [Candidatus Woesearchaeota archaeon]